MAGSVNKVILVGNLGADPEVKRTQSGDAIVNLRIATSESWRDKASGERKEKTEWTTVVVFNEQIAKVAEQYLRKGSKVYIEGKLQTRSWDDQSGNKRYATEVVIQKYQGELQMLSGGDDKPAPSRDQGSSRSYGDAKAGAGGRPSSRDLDDSIPFSSEWRG